MVECEYFFITFIVAEKTVLIDTWWNVNSENIISVGVIDLVLIDTWWNVNAFSSYVTFQYQSVLIDTWWNVN